jgi:hypothetical protein
VGCGGVSVVLFVGESNCRFCSYGGCLQMYNLTGKDKVNAECTRGPRHRICECVGPGCHGRLCLWQCLVESSVSFTGSFCLFTSFVHWDTLCGFPFLWVPCFVILA